MFYAIRNRDYNRGMALRIGAVLNGRYRIEQLLGRGGFGAVYRAYDLEGMCLVAVKENLDGSREAQRQFVREAEVLRTLGHAYLPKVERHFVVPGRGQYLIMDYVEGEDLEARVRRLGAVPYRQAIVWVQQIAGALGYLHSRRPPVIHRDVKPPNIRINPAGEAVLVDFGLVKLYEPGKKTTLGARAVTPGFSPPEQYGQGGTDARSDVYALAATLYKLVTGREPPESMSRLMGRPLRPAHQVNVHVPLALSVVIEKGMAIDPAGRYQTAGALAEALAAVVGEEKRGKEQSAENGQRKTKEPDVEESDVGEPEPASEPKEVDKPNVSPEPLPQPIASTEPERSWWRRRWYDVVGVVFGLVLLVGGGGYYVFSQVVPAGVTPTSTTMPTTVPTLTPLATLPPTTTVAPSPMPPTPNVEEQPPEDTDNITGAIVGLIGVFVLILVVGFFLLFVYRGDNQGQGGYEPDDGY